MKDEVPRKSKIYFKPASGNKVDGGWIVKTIVITFTMSAVVNMLSNLIMSVVGILVACLVLLFIICVGILFDIIGVAVTTASEAPFHSMAVRRVKGARQAIKLIIARDKVSNFCNDVVGDICGIVSGSAGAAVVAFITVSNPSLPSFLVSLLITAVVAALTVGGKAVGKSFAMKYSNTIVFHVAKIISLFG